MKFFKKLFLVLFCIGLCFSCSESDEFLDDTPLMLKKANANQVKVLPSTEIDVLTKAEEDWQNISDALDNAGPGETVMLGEGTFYLHKSIVCWDFNGTFKGSGMDKTILQTAPGITFDRSASPELEWSFELNDGHFMICFPHHSNTEERTVAVSDLMLVISEPCDVFHVHKRTNNLAGNTLQAINVLYENLLGGTPGVLDPTLSDKIDLNVAYKNIKVLGEWDPDKYLSGYSVRAGLSAFGASEGTFEAKNISIENAANGMLLHVFCGENSVVTVKNTTLNGAYDGIYSFLSSSYNITGNHFSDISGWGVQFFVNNPFVTFKMPTNLNSVVKDNILNMNSASPAIFGDRTNNVQAYGNKITGTALTGIQVNIGVEPDNCSNWSIKDNDLCDLAVSHPAGATILLNKVENSEVKNNANQVVGGSSAGDPSNDIGEAQECAAK